MRMVLLTFLAFTDALCLKTRVLLARKEEEEVTWGHVSYTRVKFAPASLTVCSKGHRVPTAGRPRPCLVPCLTRDEYVTQRTEACWGLGWMEELGRSESLCVSGNGTGRE